MLCSLLNLVKVYSIITSLYHTDGTMYVNRNNNVPVALNMKYNDYHSKNVYNVTIIHDNRYSHCFYNNENKYNYITYDKGQNPIVKEDIMNELRKLEENHKKVQQCKTTKWGAWSACSDACVMYRTRTVLQSGVECPQLTEIGKCCEIQVSNKDDEEKEEKEEKDDDHENKKHHLRHHIRTWLNDPEPDDEEDRQRIRHVFHQYKKLKYKY